MLEALSTPRNRTRTYVFLAAGCSCALAAAIVGIDDNPPGIILAFVAVAALVLAVAHPWRTAGKYGRLLILSLLGFVVFAVLHNVLYGLAGSWVPPGFLRSLVQVLSVLAFLLAILFCPPAALVGGVGSLVLLVRGRRRT